MTATRMPTREYHAMRTVGPAIRSAAAHAVGTLLLGGLVIAAGASALHGQELSEDEFSIVVLSDTEGYLGNIAYPELFSAQTDWITRNVEKLSIKFVLHLGDIVGNNNEEEWDLADEILGVLDDVIPYGLVVGDHDLGPGGRAANRQSLLFDKYFSPKRFDGRKWYGGNFRDNNQYSYQFFEMGKLKFMVVCLAFGPTDEALKWANHLVTRHGDHRVIVATHCYLNADDTRVGDGDRGNPKSYGCGGNDADAIWEKFVSRHKNVFLVLGGHVLGDGLGRLSSVGKNGNTVHQLLANYQMQRDGGDGWLRILRFRPKENKILVRTYTPWRRKYASDEQNQFELDYAMAPEDSKR